MNKKLTIDYNEYQTLLNKCEMLEKALRDKSVVFTVRLDYATVLRYSITDNADAFKNISDALRSENNELRFKYNDVLMELEKKKGFWRRLLK